MGFGPTSKHGIRCNKTYRHKKNRNQVEFISKFGLPGTGIPCKGSQTHIPNTECLMGGTFELGKVNLGFPSPVYYALKVHSPIFQNEILCFA